MHHRKRTCISIFSKIGLVDLSKSCTQTFSQKMVSCINVQLAIEFRNQTPYKRTFPLSPQSTDHVR